MFCGLRQHSGLTIYIQLSIGKVSKRPAERKCIRKTTVAEWAHNVRCLQPPYGRQKNREVHQWFLTETEGEIPDKSSISKLLATLIYESPRKLSISFLKKQGHRCPQKIVFLPANTKCISKNSNGSRLYLSPQEHPTGDLFPRRVERAP